MDIEGFRKAGYQAIDSICDYYYKIEDGSLPVMAPVQPGFLSKLIPDAAPEEGEPWEVIAKDYQDKILPGITHWQSPNFMAYFPGNATFEGGLADLHAAMISNPGFNWTCSPSVTELEIITLDWITKMLGLSQDFLSTSPSGTGGGIILGSASEVAITVAIAARERAIAHLAEQFPPPSPLASPKPSDQVNGRFEPPNQPNGEQDEAELDPDHQVAAAAEPHSNGSAAVTGQQSTPSAASPLATWRGDLTSRLVMYGTTQTHSIAAKACMILGLDFRALPVTAADNYALRGSTLRGALEEDLKAGKVPFMLIASLGTTSSAAVDRLDEIIEVARNFPSLWIHVDAAYAGVALCLPEERERCYPAALDRVDSFSTNFHKWGLIPFDFSPLLVRDRSVLTSALTLTPEFLRTRQGDSGSVLDLRNMQMPLGRRFRSLKAWFVLRSYGVQGLRKHLRSGISLAQRVVDHHLAADDRFRLVAEQRFSLVVLQLTKGDEATRLLWDELQKYTDQVLLTQTVLPEVGFCVRVAIGSPWTKEEHIDAVWAVLQKCADSVVGSAK